MDAFVLRGVGGDVVAGCFATGGGREAAIEEDGEAEVPEKANGDA